VAVQRGAIPAELDLNPAADPRVLAEVRQTLRRWLREQGANGNETAEITLAVNEACANAIEHAYSPAPAWFQLRASCEDAIVTVVVSDYGSWRSPRGRDRGRGLKIIESAMDTVDVEASDGGTQITMSRRLRR
jgi:anti-sigma regulatory factor (Ser/Thr protein kinase)